MGCPNEVTIGANLVFSVTTHDPDTGVLTDAAVSPTYRVYEDETAVPILTGSMAKLDDVNTTGFYTEQIACSVANGFENGKTYTIYIEATVDAAMGGISYGFRALTDSLQAVQTNVDNIQTRTPAALTGAGNMKADVLAINGNAAAAVTLAILNSVAVVYSGTVTGAATVTTLIDSGLTESDVDWWKGRIIIFTSVITLQATDITGFDPATDKLTFTAVTQAPVGATYVII